MNQLNLFTPPQEKGSREWGTFDTVNDIQPGMFRVLTPIKQQPRYTNVVRIRRYHPHPLTLKGAH